MLHWKPRLTCAAAGVLVALSALAGFGWTWQ